jgi:hypothetical protein
MSNRLHRILGVLCFFMFYIMLYMFYIMPADIYHRSSLHTILGVRYFFIFLILIKKNLCQLVCIIVDLLVSWKLLGLME